MAKPEVEHVAYSYIRFSTAEQAEGNSLDRQDSDTNDYAEQHGLTVVDQLRDLGFSASKAEHRKKGSLGVFLEAISPNAPQNKKLIRGTRTTSLLVEAIDRLTREHPAKAMRMCLDIIDAGVRIHTIEDGAIYDLSSTKSGIQNLAGKIDGAALFSARLAGRVRRAKQAAKKRAIEDGEGTGKWCPGWCVFDPETRKYSGIPERVEVVKSIFKMVLEGYGIDRVAKRLNDDNVPTFTIDAQGMGGARRKGARGWRGSYIRKILDNRAVLGEYQPHEWKVDPDGIERRYPVEELPPRLDMFPVIIDAATFERVRLARKQHTGGRKGLGYANLFSGMGRCSCGGRLTLINKGKRRKDAAHPRVSHRASQYLVCDHARRKVRDDAGARLCDYNGSYRYHEVEAAALDRIERIIAGLISDPTTDQAVRDLENRIAVVNEAIRRDEAAAVAMTDRFGETGLALLLDQMQRVAERVESLKAQRRSLEAELAEARGADTREHVDAILALREDALSSDVDTRFNARSRIAAALRAVRVSIFAHRGRIWLNAINKATRQGSAGYVIYGSQWNMADSRQPEPWEDPEDDTEPDLDERVSVSPVGHGTGYSDSLPSCAVPVNGKPEKKDH